MPVTNYLPSSRLIQPGVCTSSTRPASPYEGMVIYETDTNKTYVYNGSSWVMQIAADSPPGLELVKTQTVGTSVSSVTVTNAFSSTYDNYRIVYSGGVGDSNAYGINMYLGSTRTGYYSSYLYIPFSGATSTAQNSNISEFSACGIMTTNGAYVDVDLIGPNLSRFTYCKNTYIYGAVGGGGGMGSAGQYLNNTTQYTDFTIFVGASGITGGTIRVYGYRNSI